MSKDDLAKVALDSIDLATYWRKEYYEMEGQRDVARIAAAIGVLSVLALVVGMVLS